MQKKLLHFDDNSAWLSCKLKSSVTGLMPQKIILDNSCLHACGNALVNFDIVWPFLNPSFFKKYLRDMK